MSAPVQVGSVLAAKYRIERVLGEGGMGVVVAAQHLELDDRVAIKFLLASGSSNSETVARFLREARAATRIKSEHVARVLDVGRLDSGAPYMVMEFLDGRDLDRLLRERGPLPLERAADYVLQACEALAEAHALGIVHRDLKPANLFCVRRADGSELIKVLDFGISKVTPVPGSLPEIRTKTSAVFGTPYYMAPEQMRSSTLVDARADLWALGVILFELLTGRVPFQGETAMELGARVLNDPTPSVRAFRPDLPPVIELVIGRCLAKEPSGRFAHVGELTAALEAFAPASARLSAERISRILGVAAAAPEAPEEEAETRLLSLRTMQPPTDAHRASAGTDSSWGTSTRQAAPPRAPRRLLVAVSLAALGALGLAAASLTRPAAPAPAPSAFASASASDAASGPEPLASSPPVPPLVSAPPPPSASTTLLVVKKKDRTSRLSPPGSAAHSAVAPRATPSTPSTAAPPSTLYHLPD